MKCNPVEYYGHTIARLAIEQFPDGFDDEAGEGMQKIVKTATTSAVPVGIKLAHTDDEVRQEMATVGAAGICHFLPSAQARPGGDGASQVSLIRLISDSLSGQESSHHILNFFAKYIAHGEFLVSSCLRPWRIRRVWIGISQPFAR